MNTEDIALIIAVIGDAYGLIINPSFNSDQLKPVLINDVKRILNDFGIATDYQVPEIIEDIADVNGIPE